MCVCTCTRVIDIPININSWMRRRCRRHRRRSLRRSFAIAITAIAIANDDDDDDVLSAKCPPASRSAWCSVWSNGSPVCPVCSVAKQSTLNTNLKCISGSLSSAASYMCESSRTTLYAIMHAQMHANAPEWSEWIVVHSTML